MTGRDLLIGFIDLAVGAAVLATFMRRDRGVVPKDRLPEALREPLNGQPGISNSPPFSAGNTPG